MTALTVAALQLALGSIDERENIAAVSALVEEAAAKGARIVLPHGFLAVVRHLPTAVRHP